MRAYIISMSLIYDDIVLMGRSIVGVGNINVNEIGSDAITKAKARARKSVSSTVVVDSSSGGSIGRREGESSEDLHVDCYLKCFGA